MRKTPFHLWILSAGVLAAALSAAAAAGNESPTQEPPGAVVFERDILPIFRDRCISCHGPKMQGGGLRLDRKDLALAGGLSGRSILPGNGLESLLYRRVAGLGDFEQMPLQGEKLTSAQQQLLRNWIDRGASWPEALSTSRSENGRHWAYLKPVRPKAPEVKSPSWVRNEIDRFILARLEKEGLQPTPEAPKETLIRRLTLDLIGLPPSLSEIDAFLADRSPDAYEKAVDRLLSSPHYGERWARPWLDLARYADTNGYEKDNRRSIWLYRDWVIRALNADMPFDQFTIEQIAGDLLPNATLDQKIATGFHRNTMINEEGGVDPEEFRVAAVLDRVDTTATVWLGTTLACAQCHDHKFDPFTQEDYYRLFAFFNNTDDEVDPFSGSERKSRGANLQVPAPRALAAHRAQVENRITELEAVLGRQTPELDAAQAEWETNTRPLMVEWSRLDTERVSSSSGAILTPGEDGSHLASGRTPEREAYVVIAETRQTDITALRLEALSDPSLPLGGPGRSREGGFILTGFEAEIASLENPEAWQAVVFSDAVAQSGSNASRSLNDDPNSGWTVRPSAGGGPGDTQVIFLAKQKFGFEAGTRLRLRLKHESTTAQNVIGRFRISSTTGKDPGGSAKVAVPVQALLLKPGSGRSAGERETLSAYFRSIAPELQSVRERLSRARSLWEELASPTTMVMVERSEPRKSHVHVRGSFLSKGKEVTPGVPAVLNPMRQDVPLNRLSLARWLADPENPLVARVAVNRIWMHYFGRGIVETVEDFGTQGHTPSHPELLDWLATEFVRQKWSMKAIHRSIVTSAAYRQGSQVTTSLLEKDPDNRLLTRGPRLRLEAELIRDNALAVAGLLNPMMSGPSVFPTQPEGVWNLVYNDDKWVMSEGADRYRRGLYTFWRRTAPYPAFMTFDAPSREVICTRRVPTNTPLQSLTTLNGPAFFDAARGLAGRILQEAPEDLRERIIYGFRLCTARRPEEKELQRLVKLYERELRHFREDTAAAEDIAMKGDVKPPKKSDMERFAAWTIVANVLLNLDETLTKG